MLNYIKINDRLEISKAGGNGWRIYLDGSLVESDEGYEHQEDAAMAGVLYLMSVC